MQTCLRCPHCRVKSSPPRFIYTFPVCCYLLGANFSSLTNPATMNDSNNKISQNFHQLYTPVPGAYGPQSIVM